MSRTPLFSVLRRMLQKAWLADQTGLSPQELTKQARERWSPSRREFMQTSALVTAATLVPLAAGACRTAPPVTDQTPDEAPVPSRVAVVGAGMAGLHCAYRLQQAGVGAEVFEASKRAGGRMYSARGVFADGQVAELGGELINSNHVAMHGLARELGVALDDLHADLPPDYVHEIFYFDGRAIEEDEIVAAFIPLARIMAETVEIAEADEDVFDRVDQMSITAWLDEQEVEPLLRSILVEAYTAEYGLEANEQSVFNLLYLIDYANTEEFLLLGESDERFHVHEGNDALTTALAKRLEGQISFETRLVAITQNEDGTYTLGLETSTGPVEATFDHVVLAIPFTTLRKVRLDVELDVLKREVIENVGYGTNAKLMSGYTSRVWLEQYNAAGTIVTDDGYHMFWDTSRGQPGQSGLLTNFVGGHTGVSLGEGTPEERLQAVLPRIDAVFPGTAEAYVPDSAVRMHWPTAPHALGSYACYRPGQWRFYSHEGRRVGNLHFCGEHCSQDFQGFMEGACETGLLVAAEVLDDLAIALPTSALATLAKKLAKPQACYHGDRTEPLRPMARNRKTITTRHLEPVS